MVHLPVVFGKWVFEDMSWHFQVDHSKGGRMFFLKDGCTHGEIVRMAQEDYNLGKKTEFVELSYPLPDVMMKQMPQDTPPTYVSNDRQVLSLIELSKTHVVRLCVSTRLEMDTDVGGRANDCHGDAYDDMDEDWDEDADELVDEGVDEDVDDVATDYANVEVEDEVDESDEDYTVYGKVKDEDEDEDDTSVDCEGFISRRGGEGVISEKNWSDNIHVEKSFPNKKELMSELRMTAVMQKFAYKADKSTKTLFVAKCLMRGCKWKLRASVKDEPNTFWVTKYVKVHTCSVADRAFKRRSYTPRYIAKLFIDRFGIIDGIVPKHIKDSMRNMYGLKMDYSTSYRALIFAQELVRGTAQEGYDKLPSYLHLIEEANPGSVTDLVRDEKNRFKYLFLSFGASIADFRYLRRVIVVDGTHLNGKYEGVLLVATGQDANFQIFPLAFGIVDSECDAAWDWFFTNLRRCFSDEYPMVIVSDQHSSIAKACENVLPWATRGICYYHLQQNIVTNFRGKHLMHLVKGAAYAYTLPEYNRYMDTLRAVNPALAKYLEDADPKLWSRVHFPGDRYNIKTSNITESINAALKQAKGFPISFLLEFIREKLSRWFWKRREDALGLTTHHSRGVETLLAIRAHYADKMAVERIDQWRFHVRDVKQGYVVDLERRKCSCGLFDVEKIPCSHAIAAATEAGMNVSTFVCPMYARDYLYATYVGNIYPTNGESKAGDVPLLPPVVKPAPGRKKKSRWQTWLEMSKKRRPKPRKLHKQYSCSKCRQTGHTRPHCVS